MSHESRLMATLLYCCVLPGEKAQLAVKALPEAARDAAYELLGEISVTSDNSGHPETYYIGAGLMCESDEWNMGTMKNLAGEIIISMHKDYIDAALKQLTKARAQYINAAWYAFVDFLLDHVQRTPTWAWRLIPSSYEDG